MSLGTPGGMQFEIGSGSLALGIEKLDRVRFFVETELKRGELVLKSSDADGFLAKLLPADGITTEFNLGLGIANDAGLYFIGSSGLEIRLPLHLALGPVEIQYLTLGATFKAGEIPVTAATGISAKLGPLGAAVEDIGVKATFVSRATARATSARSTSRSASSRRTASACRSTPASSRAAATCTSTPSAASTPARSSWTFAGLPQRSRRSG